MGSNVNDENLCQISPILANLITLTKCYEFYFLLTNKSIPNLTGLLTNKTICNFRLTY